MKTKFTWFGIVAACILGISTAFISCENDVNAIIQYEGKVVHKGTTTPFSDLEVKITNGDKIHTVDHTDTNGNFTLNVRVNEIDGSFYVLVGDSSCITKRMELSSYGQEKVNLGTIEIEGPSLPMVSTKTFSDISDTKATSGGNVTADGRSSVTARGVCWSKSEYPTIDDEHTQNGSGLGEFKSQITNIEAGTTYYVRAYATNRMGTAYGDQLVFSTKTGLPQVSTDEVGDISATTATCGGNVADNSGYPITARGVCWSDKTATPTINNEHTEEVATIGHFTSLMIGLESNTTYYVRAYAINEKGTNYGDTKIFTTLSGLPTAETSTFSNLKATQVQCHGKVTSDGGFSIKSRGFCYSNTSSIPTIEDKKTEEIADIGVFTSTITDLVPDTKYYVRAYASNEMGTAYGAQISFTTENGLPQVKTNIVKSCTETSAIIECESFENEEFNINERGVCWDIKPNPTIANNRTYDGNGVGVYESSITGIDIENVSNTYYVRAYATNTNGTVYGNEIVLNHINLEYEKLPRIEYDGYVYVLFNDIGKMSFYEAVKACDELNFAGYDDWMLPPKEDILQYIMSKCDEGWKDYHGNACKVILYENATINYHDLDNPDDYWTNQINGNNYSVSTVDYGSESFTRDGIRYYYNSPYSQYSVYGENNYQDSDVRHRVRPVRSYKIY